MVYTTLLDFVERCLSALGRVFRAVGRFSRAARTCCPGCGESQVTDAKIPGSIETFRAIDPTARRDARGWYWCAECYVEFEVGRR